MRKFRVVVNGNVYEVEVEEIGSTPTTILSQPAAPAQAPAPAPVPAAAAAPAPAPAAAPAASPAAAKPAAPAPKPAAGSAGGNAVTAPMPGTIRDVKVKPGDKVEPRTVVMLLEAMKMENEIFAGMSGLVKEVAVSKGTSVNTGDLLVTIDPA
ncbi:MAG: biotin/lipoyl-containing protein [Bacillota bacterium]